MLRRLWLFGLTLAVAADATALPGIDLTVAPAWKGWSRPGRPTEVDIRLRAGTAVRATVAVDAGRQSVRTALDLEPGRWVRLHVPVGAAEALSVTVESAGGGPERRNVGVALSESPLLGVSLATEAPVAIDGFHMVTLDADDLPRNASAYASIDALVIDAPTLVALDQRQLGALVAHTAACGRTALVNPDPRTRGILEGAAGCEGRFLVSATSARAAAEMLHASLAIPRAPTATLADLGALSRPDHAVWNRVLVMLAAYFCVAALVLALSSSTLAFLLVPAVATGVLWASLYWMDPASQLLVWSEAASGARIARYDAWQRFPGVARKGARVPTMSHLGAVRACDANVPMRFDYDPQRGMITAAAFDARLFQSVLLCYSGEFPIMRAATTEARHDHVIDVRNVGTLGWPAGFLLAERGAYVLPALGPGESARVDTRTGGVSDAATVAAMSRMSTDGNAALWKLDLRSVEDAPPDSAAWLLVSIPPP